MSDQMNAAPDLRFLIPWNEFCQGEKALCYYLKKSGCRFTINQTIKLMQYFEQQQKTMGDIYGIPELEICEESFH